MIYDLRFKNLSPKTYHLKSHQRKSAGFSLVEVLVAAAVLIISVTGTLSLIARNVTSAAEAKDRVTAFYLAQEALEYVRGVRDNNAITRNPGGWLAGLEDCMETEGSPCMIDVNADIVSDCVGSIANPCDQLLLRESDGVYNYTDGDTTKFTREVVIEDVTAGEEVRVNATVRWMSGVERSFTISGNLFNWR